MKLLSFTKGWKTYATVLVGLGVGVMQANSLDIPNWVDWSLGFMGLGFHRLAVQNQSKLVAQQVEALVKAILDQVSVPDDGKPSV